MSHTEEQRKYVDINEFVALTGMSISTVGRRKKDGTIRFYQPGGPRTRVLFPCDAIEGHVPSQTSSNATLSADKPDGTEDAPADSSQKDALPLSESDSSRRPGPKARWRRKAR